ncbi:nesprin-1 [Caerostris extrusa]|uniref:Nesprin-1 n=1 Tax=Caerostris extrusa TaxID=172846 RepID=A0AAV4P9B6_CAEEX|nr:nesprin-1 [Caerostris extrusa]
MYTDIETMKSKILENCCKCESLCLNHQKFSLNWSGCQPKDFEQSFNWYKILKIKVFEAVKNAKNSKYCLQEYQLSFELLKQLLHLLENVVSSQPCIESQKKLEDWDLWEAQIVELNDLIERSSIWLQEKNLVFNSVISNDNDFKQSYSILKNLQWDLLDFTSDINHIKTLKNDLFSHIEMSEIEKSSSEIINICKELQNNVDSKLNTCIMSNEWAELKTEVEGLQHCLNTSKQQITKMCKKINHLGSDDSILKFLQDISKLEADIESKEKINKWVTDSINQEEEFSNAFNSNESKTLRKICDQWNEIPDSIVQIKTNALQKIAHSEKSEIKEKFKLWVKDVGDSFNSINSEHALCITELKNIELKLIGFLKTLDVVIEYLDEDNKEGFEDSDIEGSQALDKDKIQVCKLKIKCELEKIKILILQYDEYNRLSKEAYLILERVQNFLEKIRNKIWQMDYSEISPCKTKIEGYQKLLGCKVFNDVKRMHSQIAEKIKDKNRPNPPKKLSELEDLISLTMSDIEKYHNFWNRYMEAEKSCKKFISNTKYSLSVYCESIVDTDHLKESVETAQNLLDDFISNQKLVDHLKLIGSEFEQHLMDRRRGLHEVQSLLRINCGYCFKIYF